MAQAQEPPPSHCQGYLYKKTRDGRWQKRWFETTGCFLTYYKSKKMTKLLAALNLPQVGDIKVVDDACFSIHLNDRDYLLKAADAAAAQRWVDVLNQLKTSKDDKSTATDDNKENNARDKAWQKPPSLLCCFARKRS
eukprot:CAMPEP_0118914168 /NCGR_PEP_ID=MMETSP1166-20130328/14628_1 /TAXON_ID=1104430 /ORGANISM="Chrysoreinhardia sp, Strain CCMP3193" /LENGTH=136 /DNA_ID=CAMNT_0006853735 /DNA_START=68 /DNA_END=478 /DNA_ORIENTATION=-